MNIAEKSAKLAAAGFRIGVRLPQVNYAHPGKFSITESEITVPCKDASEAGGFAIVGDDLAKLVDEAFLQLN